MKKLLSMIGVITLIGTASASVIACWNWEVIKKIDISYEISSEINLGQLSANTANAFLANLQRELARITNLNTITPSDYDVYKEGTATAIQDSDISKDNKIIISIKIKSISRNFSGIAKNINVKYIKNKKEIINYLDSSVFSLAFKDNDLYFGCNNRNIYIFNTLTKKIKSNIILFSSVESLIFKDNDLYAGTYSGKIYKINITNISINLFFDLESPVYSLAFKDNDLYAGTYSGNIYKINITNKNKEKVYYQSSPVYSLAFKDNDLYAGYANNKIYNINNKKIFINLNAPVYSLAFKDNDLYAGTYYGNICKINIKNKISQNITDLESQVENLAFKDNDLYAGTYSGNIYKIDLVQN